MIGGLIEALLLKKGVQLAHWMVQSGRREDCTRYLRNKESQATAEWEQDDIFQWHTLESREQASPARNKWYCIVQASNGMPFSSLLSVLKPFKN
jgi:hypothetical protein